MSGGTIAVIIVVVVVIIAALAAAGMIARRRRLQQQFGPEYDRAVTEQNSKLRAEAELADRQRRVRKLDIRPLSEASRAQYAADWVTVQERFVDSPESAVSDAYALVTAVMEERGYPTTDDDQVLSDLSVEHAQTVGHFRSAQALSASAAAGTAATEDLRQALIHYRALFSDLLGEPADDNAGGPSPLTPARRQPLLSARRRTQLTMASLHRRRATPTRRTRNRRTEAIRTRLRPPPAASPSAPRPPTGQNPSCSYGRNRQMTSQPDRPVTGSIDTDENVAGADEAPEPGSVSGSSEDYHSGYGASSDSGPGFVAGPDGVTDADRTAGPVPDGDIPADEDPDLVVMTPREDTLADGTGMAADDLPGSGDVIIAEVIETEYTSTGLNGSPATGAVPDNTVTDNTGANNTVADNTVADNTGADNTVLGSTGAGATGPAANGTGQATDRGVDGLDQQWHDIQAMFVDDPRGSVDAAAAAADAAVSALVETLHQRQAALVPAGTAEGDHGDTEQLREALRSYRIFCQRIADLGQQLPEAAGATR